MQSTLTSDSKTGQGQAFRAGELDKYPSSLVRVRFQDCDPFGHLHNSNYIDYVMNAREEHLRDFYDLDLFSPRFAERSWVVRSSALQYHLPVVANQQVRIATHMLHYSRSAITIEAAITDPDGSRLFAGCWVEFRYFDIRSGRPVRHEEDLLDLFVRVSLNEAFEFGDPVERMKQLRTGIR